MTTGLQAKIVESLKSRPNQGVDGLARQLGCSRKEVQQLLYGSLKGRVEQDRNYRWSLAAAKSGRSNSVGSGSKEKFADTDLARLCRYYLACLGFDYSGVSVSLKPEQGEPDYVEVSAIPHSPNDFSDSDSARMLLGRKRTERGSFGLYFGYPTLVASRWSPKARRKLLTVEPILLFPIEEEPGTGQLAIDMLFPIVNQKPFQSFTNIDPSLLMNEVVQLEHELGLTGEDKEPGIDEIAMRLQSIRPEWPWKEDIDPGSLEKERSPLGEVANPGIHNRAVLLMAEKSQFTKGLEVELRSLAQLQAGDYGSTALGRWIAGSPSATELAEKEPPSLVEVLPMNAEQRQAVKAALSQPVTVITGPPGTGKSQVVTNLLVNAAWAGKRVLFASKNNKAVDVVESRVNALGSRPILLRLGRDEYQARVAKYILALLSATTTAAEKEEFEDARSFHKRLLKEHAKLTEETQRLISLRNEVDGLEQIAEEAREQLGPKLFGQAMDINVRGIETKLESVSSALISADRSLAGAISKVFWRLSRRGRMERLASRIREAQSSFVELNVDPPAAPSQAADVPGVRAAIQMAAGNLNGLKKSARYFSALNELQSLRPLEEIAKEEARMLLRLARHSEQLWKLWLRLQPSILSEKERNKLGKYTSLLEMISDAGKGGKPSNRIYGKYNELLRSISHLLPCWAVTSLSTRGRIPLEPGIFDLVVFDEASQCDIASALPLLYRAKSAVVIGDPNQLSHISSLPRGQDQALLERHDLVDDFLHWSYSYRSLFGLGTTQVGGESIVNLVDHHRSHADIIGFSNKEFYEERLRVATNYDKLRFPGRSEPGILWINVKGKMVRPNTGSAMNAIEAKAVVDALRDLVLDKEYKGSVGVVTPFRAQANSIREAVNRDARLSSELTQREFLVDTVHKFQGDERDVMIFSSVVSSEIPQGALGFLRTNSNLFNVAITRARAQLVVVGDQAACSSCGIDYLERFAAYATSQDRRTPQGTEPRPEDFGPTYPKVANPELVSDWERHFYVAAYGAGFRLMPQFNIEKYVVDFLLMDGERKLVIEIDGERYHRNWTGELCRRDQIRNQRLFELGYDVQRFWVYEVRDDMDGCLARLRQWQLSNETSGTALH